MRVILTAGLLALSALAAPALAAPPSEVSAPAQGRYVYVGVSKSDDGRERVTYVVAPDKGQGGGQVDVWVVDVFTAPLATPKGLGAYATARETIDCDRTAVKTTAGGLFGIDGSLLDTYVSNGDVAFEEAQPGSMGYATGTIVCRTAAGDLPVLEGLDAVLADARGRAPQ
jgi:hypothetical protein